MSTKAKKEVAAPEAPAKKPKRLGRKLLFLGAAIVLGGGGLGAGLYASGLLAVGEGEAHVEQPHLVPREDASSEAIAHATEKARTGKIDPHVFQATYHAMENNFTSNLRGGQAFVQIGMGVSTYYDERVIERLKKHEMAVRSAILLVLSEQDPLVLATAEGKQELRNALKKAENNE
jgi:flagellar FliL protein